MATFEIKFRGKSISRNEWVYGDYTRLVLGGIIHHYIKPLDCNVVEVKEETVGQMWKPSEGLIVFTGDLLKAECSVSCSKDKKQRICKIVFEPRGMNVVIWNEGEWYTYGSMNFTTAKVIGNIFDNSNLLIK